MATCVSGASTILAPAALIPYSSMTAGLLSEFGVASVVESRSPITLGGGSLVTSGSSIALGGGSLVTSGNSSVPGGGSLVTTCGSNVATVPAGGSNVATVPTHGSVATGERVELPPLAGLLLLPLGVDLVSLASTANQLAVARAVTIASASAVAISPDVAITVGLSPLELRAQLDAVSGAGLAGAQSTAIHLGAAVSSAIADQTAFWRSGETNDATEIISRESVANALGYGATERRDGPFVTKRTPVFTRTWRAWGSFFGGAVDISADVGRGSPAANSNYYGGVVGLDYQIDPSWLVGVAAGGSSSRFTVASQQTSGDISAFHGGLYTSYLLGRSYLEISETFSAFQNSTTRAVGGFGLRYDKLTGAFSSREYRTRAEIGHSFDLPREIELGSAKLTPFAAAEVAVYESDAFSEKSLVPVGSLALSIAERTTVSLPTFLGLRFSHSLFLPNGWRVSPTGSVAWAHEFFPQRRLTSAFVAAAPGASFTVFGPRDAYNLVQTKIGLQAHIDERVALFTNFQGEFSGRTRSYGGKGGVSYSW